MPARNSRSYDLNISTVIKDIWSDGVKLGNSNVSKSDTIRLLYSISTAIIVVQAMEVAPIIVAVAKHVLTNHEMTVENHDQ